jgi:hypothetical protein
MTVLFVFGSIRTSNKCQTESGVHVVKRNQRDFVSICLLLPFYFFILFLKYMTSWEFKARQHGMGGQFLPFDFKLHLGQRS